MHDTWIRLQVDITNVATIFDEDCHFVELREVSYAT